MKRTTDGVIFECVRKVNVNDVGYIMTEINDEYHYFLINTIGTK